MRRSAPPLFLLAAVAGCSSTGGTAASPPGRVSWPISWPNGAYVLEATVEYQQDNAAGSFAVREDYSADLYIVPLGSSLALRHSNSFCRDPTRQEVERDEALRRKTFRCGDFTYVVEPAGSTVRGEVTAMVTERFRRRGECIRVISVGPDGNEQCAGYRWDVISRRTRKRAKLTVIPRS